MGRNDNFERTYIMLKPDAVKRHLMGEIISRIEKKGFKITAMKMFTFTEDLVKEHYSHLVDKPFFPEILEFITSGPVVGMIIEGSDVITGMRKLMGSTSWLNADIGTIRGDYSCKEGENLIHGSDSIENANEEIKRFFGENA
ncbi:MAG: nucleoside-diphosphate kinase [Spirochaetales bacterium]